MKNDPKKPLPRAEWSDAEERRREKERVSGLLDAESGSATSGEPGDPERAEVSGMPLDDSASAPVYGMPSDDLPPRSTVYGMPAVGASSRAVGASSRAGVFIAIAAVALGALAVWYFLH